jgi:glycosyltransferase involved in cell wall biosynthesis
MSIPRGLRSLLSLATQPLRSSSDGPELYYVVPGVNWVLDWVGFYVTRDVQAQFGLRAQVVSSARDLAGQLVHYGSLWDILANLDARHTGRNVAVGTIFHGQKDSPEFQDALGRVLAKKGAFAKLHTASSIMEQRLLSWGVPRERLVSIPLGVDLDRFGPATAEERSERRKELGIPEDAFCIGSFHKDGQGMAEGEKPKLIKGPDVLVQTLAQLNKRHANIFVLLSAPARGYVKKGLDAAGVQYRHVVEEDYHRIPRLYDAIDLYLLTSREEGGPKGVLEALASGVPFVGTKVGLVPDVVRSGIEGLLTEIEDVPALVDGVGQLIELSDLRKQFVGNGLKRIQDYDWPIIAARYYHEIYEPLLRSAK